MQVVPVTCINKGFALEPKMWRGRTHRLNIPALGENGMDLDAAACP